MRKEDADRYKAEEDAADDDLDSLEEPLDYFSEEELAAAINRLNCLTEVLEDEVSDFALDKTSDYLDSSRPEMVRSFWWSKGMSDYIIFIDSSYQFRGYGQDGVPEELITTIANTIIANVS